MSVGIESSTGAKSIGFGLGRNGKLSWSSKRSMLMGLAPTVLVGNPLPDWQRRILEPETKHKVKGAYVLPPGARVPRFYVAECICGWSTPLCQTQGRANELYADHKAKAAMKTTEGMES